MAQESSHRVVALVDAGSNPFELGCATEVFGLHRPDADTPRPPAVLDVVARRSGLGTATNLRALLRRETGLTPTEYRRRFGAQRSPGPSSRVQGTEEATTPGST